jgi:hypothetical protein
VLSLIRNGNGKSMVCWFRGVKSSHLSFDNTTLSTWRELFSLTPLLERDFSCSLLLLSLTGATWWRLEMQKGHRIDRQTESGIKCVGHSGGDTQPLLLLFSIFFNALHLYGSIKPCF